MYTKRNNYKMITTNHFDQVQGKNNLKRNFYFLVSNQDLLRLIDRISMVNF